MTKAFEVYANYDNSVYLKHSNILFHDTQLKYVGKIVQYYHIIEKGLTMPEMRLGFGRAKLINLIDECLEYQKKYDTKNVQFLHALSVISEYRQVHAQHNFELDSELLSKIDKVLNCSYAIPHSEQIMTTRNEYFAAKNKPFDVFSSSRHSVRNFDGTITLDQINKAVALAQNTPTACNRQSTRVHVVENKDLMAQIFGIQNGNRGFGHLADKLIVVTADLSSYQDAEERNLSYVDGGMYTMNLLYALHFNDVAACPLNWCRSPKDESKMRTVIGIPNSEVIVVLIACGSVPENFKLASSKRNNYQDILRIH